MNLLELALRNWKPQPSEEKKESDGLEQAMSDFGSATNDTERAAAFRAAITLAKSD